MAKKKAGESANLKEQALPGMEEDTLPEGLEKAINRYHATHAAQAQSHAEHKKTTDQAFDTLKRLMHEHNILTVKLRVNGEWKLFQLNKTEKGKFRKIVRPQDQKASVKKKAG